MTGFLTVQAHGGNKESSGLDDLFDKHVNHLTVAQSKFLRHWDRLIDLEAKVSQVQPFYIEHNGFAWHAIFLCLSRFTGSQVSKQDMLQNRGEDSTNSLSSIVLDISNGFSFDKSAKDGRFIYQFLRRKLHHYGSEMPRRESINPSTPRTTSADCTLKCGDRVVLTFS